MSNLYGKVLEIKIWVLVQSEALIGAYDRAQAFPNKMVERFQLLTHESTHSQKSAHKLPLFFGGGNRCGQLVGPV
jgi:hypothetical protein